MRNVFFWMVLGLMGSCSDQEDPSASQWSHCQAHDALIRQAADSFALDWVLVKAIVLKESHADPWYVSTAGAVGLMQLMPREGSWVSSNYQNFQEARKKPRNQAGQRVHRGKTVEEWAGRYVAQLDSLKALYYGREEELLVLDRRFGTLDNLVEGTRQFADDVQYFRSRKHGPYVARLLALAAYNAGRGAVAWDRTQPRLDRIPINRQTELYVALVERMYQALLAEEGVVNARNEWILEL
ncbi:MAG: transglycosylase SLT domain-containing protein [Bacteroidota bacterium]